MVTKGELNSSGDEEKEWGRKSHYKYDVFPIEEPMFEKQNAELD